MIKTTTCGAKPLAPEVEIACVAIDAARELADIGTLHQLDQMAQRVVDGLCAAGLTHRQAVQLAAQAMVAGLSAASAAMLRAENDQNDEPDTGNPVG